MKLNARRILRLHAALLVVLAVSLTLAAYLGVFLGKGPFGGFAENPLVVIGLAQAYPLMGLVAATIWMGSRGPTPWRFSILAIAAHCVPLSALVLFWGPIRQSSIGYTIPLSLLIHGAGITVEAISLRIAGQTLSTE